jgi:chemotaxis protein methyltransferase CheR
MDADSWSAEAFRPIAGYLADVLGVHLPPHRLQLLRARLQGRLRADGVTGFAPFQRQLNNENGRDHAAQLLIDLSTVNHTSFFREPQALQFLANHLAHALLEGKGTVRVWSAGCSTGQEPYSLLMVLADRVPDLAQRHLEYWASDLSLGALRAAARAVYDERSTRGIDPERLRRYFLRGRGPKLGTFRVVPELRQLVRFVHLDLKRPVWNLPAQFDAILCRNVAIYFDEAERLQLLERLTNQLRPGGWLVIGQGEILSGTPANLLRQAPSIFRRVERS